MAACRSRFVAAITRTLARMHVVPPTRSNSCSCRTRHNLLEHRCRVDFLPQRNVFVPELLLSLLAILDIGRRGIPAYEAPLFIPNRIKANKKPSILPVFSPVPRFDLERAFAFELARNFPRRPFRILWMKQPV